MTTSLQLPRILEKLSAGKAEQKTTCYSVDEIRILAADLSRENGSDRIASAASNLKIGVGESILLEKPIAKLKCHPQNQYLTRH